jgi:hypothetical protein
MQGPSQDTFTVAVDNSNAGTSAQKGLIQKLVHPLAGFFRSVADNVELFRNVVMGCGPRRIGSRRSSGSQRPEIFLAGPHLELPHGYFHLIIIKQGSNDARGLQILDLHPVANRHDPHNWRLLRGS